MIGGKRGYGAKLCESEGKISGFGVRAAGFGVRNGGLQSTESERVKIGRKKWGKGLEKGDFVLVENIGVKHGDGDGKGEMWSQNVGVRGHKKGFGGKKGEVESERNHLGQKRQLWIRQCGFWNKKGGFGDKKWKYGGQNAAFWSKKQEENGDQEGILLENWDLGLKNGDVQGREVGLWL